MIRFNNDYNRAAHPRILEALAKANGESHPGYGLDSWCERAARAICSHLGEAGSRAHVHFVTGGTQANFTVINAALRPFESVLAADTGHINVHETGAVEHGGHKIEPLAHVDGKITAEQVRAAAHSFAESPVQEHITCPRMVYISFTTEYGTLYSRAELELLSQACRESGLYLFVDGARMGYGLGSPENDLELADFARLTDVFTIGGTKCGALFGEAVVVMDEGINRFFRSHIKQNGGMLAKGWLLGLQFATLFEDGLYFDINSHADEQALRLREAFRAAGVPFFVESPSNQQFVIMEDAALDRLAQRYAFEEEGRVDEAHRCVRFCTSWATTDEEVDALVADIGKLAVSEG